MNHAQRRRDFESLQALADRLLPELAEALDAGHGIQHGERHWRIMLGHFLSRYLSLAFNRYHSNERALDDYAIDGTAVLDFDAYTLATQNSLSFLCGKQRQGLEPRLLRPRACNISAARPPSGVRRCGSSPAM